MLIIDDALAVVGSINFDRLSLERMEEGSLVISDPQVVKSLEASWAEDIRHSKEIHL